ncbi:type II toxin-antitoxin system antitoxin SocA domain-containing protein [uncultured Sphingomonas sp.]|uniref:Panacea domain-containing protein n=1 Tax=uncultured Sphingomonas sp. TaxID=158754 RepID=UPI0025E3B9F7|nr:type II toxin-antitoxin system antitoxin SocA domain-containing protein [uncultured Sphingomonas sp.]
MKLQKLLFYAHAWHLAYDKGPLFENDFEAWPWGPVVRDVYVQTKGFGRSRVTSPITEFAWGPQGPTIQAPTGVSEELRPFIRSVWDTLKVYDGVQLSNSTHASGEPWTIISDTIGTGSKPIIPNDLIRRVFAQKLEAQVANPSTQ